MKYAIAILCLLAAGCSVKTEGWFIHHEYRKELYGPYSSFSEADEARDCLIESMAQKQSNGAVSITVYPIPSQHYQVREMVVTGHRAYAKYPDCIE